MEAMRKLSVRFRTPVEKKEDVELDLEEALTNIYGLGLVMADIKKSLLDVPTSGKTDDEDESCGEISHASETFGDFCTRQAKNVLNFLVEDWCLSIMLGVITAVLSVGMDVLIEILQHLHVTMYHKFIEISTYLAFGMWTFHVVFFVGIAAVFCQLVSKQAVGSGIPEVKVIMHGFKMKNYLTFRTLIAKMVGLTLAMGGGLPIGKEGPFVHMGAIVATLLSKLTASCQYSAFFSNEGREMELLSSGCAVGIACTFSAPVGAVLYAIESTSKYFAVKNYWRAFLAATCSAIIFRFANFFVTAAQSGTITAFYQTSFPTESFLIEELALFALLGFMGGLAASLFIFTHRQITLFRAKNRLFKMIFKNNFLGFTVFMAAVVGIVTFPLGLGKYIAGKLTFRETMADFFNNCTWHAVNQSDSCNESLMQHWTGGPDGGVSIFLSLTCYLIINFMLVAICISINVPAGVFVPSFIIGAAGGRLMGEMMAYLFPDGLRGPDGPPIYPGLYAVVGAASYTGAVTHTLSVAVIICELTGQLAPILPVLIALLTANALCKFLQPSIYESIIRMKQYPYLPDLPPSRVSVHTVKVEQIMIQDVIFITKSTTYRELREVLKFAPHLKSFPVLTDTKTKILLGSVAKKYLLLLMRRHLIECPSVRSGRRTPAEIFNHIRRTSMRLSRRQGNRRSERSLPELEKSEKSKGLDVNDETINDISVTGNTLLSISPLHPPKSAPLTTLFSKPSGSDIRDENGSFVDIEERLDRVVDLDEVAIDSAPFQLVMGSSLYKVHTLFSLLGLSHAYVTDCGRMMGVIALKELRDALANIYVRGAVPVKVDRKLTSSEYFLPKVFGHGADGKEDDDDEEKATPNYGTYLSVPTQL
uniref:Chloride channel protein n=1 Tax=Steinernema glaseri TaxID=37863 RepID=A0A1I7YF69_9BILA